MNAILNRKFVERFIVTAIILTLVHSFLAEYSVYARWSVASRNTLLYTGFIFDLIFSIEFIVKGIIKGKGRHFFSYIKYERGWADLLTSLPVLAVYTVPMLYVIICVDIQGGAAASGVISLLKTVKDTNIIGILRLLRIIKLFNKIPHINSKMTRHHAAKTAATAVCTALAAFMIWSLLEGLPSQSAVEKRRTEYSRMITELESISSLNNLSFRESCENFLLSDLRVMRILYNTGHKTERLSEPEFRKYYNEEDYIDVRGGLCSLMISVKDIESGKAGHNLLRFFIIVSLAAAFIFLYSAHFTATVSDVADVLNSGFRKKDYNFMVKLREEYRDEELYRLARFYNDAYLPAKLRKRSIEKDGSGTALTMNDMENYRKRD